MSNNTELLSKVKAALGITGTHQDETLLFYIEDVKAFMISAGVLPRVVESAAAFGAIARGVADLWNYGNGDTKFSEFFQWRVAQLKYTADAEQEAQLTYTADAEQEGIGEVTGNVETPLQMRFTNYRRNTMLHTNQIYDSDMHLIIDPVTREINGDLMKKRTLVQHDHNSERLTFEIPRYIEGHDMSLCDRVSVHFTNADTAGENQNSDMCTVDDLQVSPDDAGAVIFSWLVSRAATVYAGTLTFSITFECFTDGKVYYSFSTLIFSGITVRARLNNAAGVLEKYSDAIAEFEKASEKAQADIESGRTTALSDIESVRTTTLDGINEAKATMLKEIELAAEIVQTTGDSETAVMSQKVVTEGLVAAEAEIRKMKTRVNDTSGNKYGAVTNLIDNGNFAKTPLYLTWTGIKNAPTVSGNTLSSTATNTDVYAGIQTYARKTTTEGEVYYFRARVRVTNPDCQKIKVMALGGRGNYEVNNPQENRWYDIYSTVNARTETSWLLQIEHHYADAETANGKVMEVQDVMMINLSEDFGLGINPPLYQVEKIYTTNGYWEGTQEVIIANEKEKKESDYYVQPKTVYNYGKRKPIVTFICDDAWNADYAKMRPLSEKYNIPFVTAAFRGSNMLIGKLLWLQNELGWEVASHTLDHLPLDTEGKLTEEDIEHQLYGSKKYLSDLGINCKNLVYAYGNHNDVWRRIAAKYYRCAPTGNTRNDQSNMEEPQGVNTGVVSSFWLKRYPLGSYGGDEDINTHKARVNDAIAHNGWLIYMLHPNAAEHTDEKTAMIEELIQYIQSDELKGSGIEIKTLDEGYDIFGNALEVGDYICGSEGCAIAYTGEKANF